MPDTPALALSDARKRFGAVIALDGISASTSTTARCSRFSATTAPVSTWIMSLSGAHRLDSGSIEMDGVPVTVHAVRCARTRRRDGVPGSRALRQPPTDNFYAARDLLAGPTWLPRSLRFLKRRRMTESTREVLERLQVSLPDFLQIRADVRRTAAGGCGEQGRRVRFEGRDPRRAHGRAGRARVAPGARPDPPASSENRAVIVVSRTR